MTYARSRLWLGICGVGTMVVLAVFMLATRFRHHLFPNIEHWRPLDLLALIGFVGVFLVLMLPFDLLGGYLLPRRHGRLTQSFRFCFETEHRAVGEFWPKVRLR